MDADAEEFAGCAGTTLGDDSITCTCTPDCVRGIHVGLPVFFRVSVLFCSLTLDCLPSTYAREIFVAQSNYGIGPRGPILSLPSALHQVGGGRSKLVFVNNGYTGGYVEAVIDRVAGQARGAGTVVEVLTRPTELGDVCRSSIRGSSACIAAAVFSASPSEGPGGKWNYTIRADSSLGPKLDMTKLDNAEQIYTLPLQHAIDWAIADVTNGSTAYLPESVCH